MTLESLLKKDFYIDICKKTAELLQKNETKLIILTD